MSTISQGVGFIEADGTIQINPQGNVSIEVEQVEPRPLFELQDLFHGTVSRRGTRDAWRWRVSKKGDVLNLLRFIRMAAWGAKKDQARITLNFMNGNTSLRNARNVLTNLKTTNRNRTCERTTDNEYRFVGNQIAEVSPPTD